MEDQKWAEPPDSQDKDTNKQSRWSEHCKTFIIRDAHGAIKELVFPRALDLDRPKRERTIFSSRQLGCLEEEFKQNQYLVGKERSAVAKRLGLSETQVKVWFQNRRTKHKKDNERCGDGKDFQAERKAARNVLKLLEYKTALNYSTFLTPTPTHLDTYQSLTTNTMDYLGGQSSNITNNRKEKMLDVNLKQPHILLDHSSLEIHDVGFESRSAVKDIPVDTVPKFSPVSSSSESFQNSNSALLHLDVDDYPEEERELVKTSGRLGRTRLKSTDCVNNKGLLLDNSHCLDNMLKHPGIQIDNIDSGDLSLDDSANADEYILSAKEKLNEEIRTRMQNKKQGNTDLSRVCTRFHPYPGFTHCTAETSQETCGHEEHVHTVDNTGCRRQPLFSEGRVLENNDGRPAHSITSNITTSREMHGGILTNSYNTRSIGHYLSNLMNCPSSIHNTYVPYQTTMFTPGQGSHYPPQLPHTNMKHYNYYVPNLYGPGVNETSPPLRILQHAPVCNSYGDGLQQRSYASYAMSTPQNSFLSQPTVHGLSSQHQRYHLGTPFN